MREQISIAMAEDDVRNDLLEARVVLNCRTGHEQVTLADHRLVAIQLLADEAVPRPVGKDVLSPHAQDLLRRGGPHAGAAAMRTRPRPNTAISSAVRSTSSSVTGRK